MRKSYRYLATLLMAGIFSIAALAQNVTISGTVRNSTTKESAPSVSITVKGTNQGTFTNERGEFRLTVAKLPAILQFTSIGFDSTEVTVNSASEIITVDLVPSETITISQVIVYGGTRTGQKYLESPVSSEYMPARTIREAASPSYYDAVRNLKGVDLTTSSLTFTTPSTRGFNGSGNLRFNQLVDGIDNQAPGLNFAVGSIVGPTSLDVDNMELLQGASSALYGSGGMNGTLLITSKSPFKYQGLSYEIKQGMMHVDGRERSISPYYDWSMRWARKVSEKLAFKISSQLVYANDWEAQDYRNMLRNNVFSEVKGGDRVSDPNYNGVNVFGDEVSANLYQFGQAYTATIRANPLSSAFANTFSGGATTDIAVYTNGVLGNNPTNAQLGSYFTNLNTFLNSPGITAITTAQQRADYLAAIQGYVPINLGFNNSTIPNREVSRTGYEEKYVVDYNAYSLKLNGGINYKITNNIEASLLGYWGTGTTVYTGADRYAIRNFKMGQYKLEFKGKNWFLRGYTIQENSGDSYTATTAAIYIDRAWKSDANWLTTYAATYSEARRTLGYSDWQAQAAARAAADAGRFLPGTTQFNTAFQNAKNTTIGNGGAKFDDQTDMYHLEGQLNLTEYVKFAETLIGASYRQFALNSHGSIFADTAGVIHLSEIGAYIQLQRWLFNERLKLTLSGRYDKNENFEGRFTPRATALIKIAKDNHIRLSYQQAYRFPSTQDQYINLLTGGANQLIGMGQIFKKYYQFDTKPGKTAESIVAYRSTLNPALLVNADFPDLKPETVNSYEIGYRGVLSKKLLFDAYLYYSQYKDFIGRVAVGRGKSASSNPITELTELASPFTTTNYSFVVNTTTSVHAIGWGLSADYEFIKDFHLLANVSGDRLNDVPAGYFTQFNTPKVRYNIGLSNDRVTKYSGFNIIWRWQEEVFWEGTFATGTIPSFGTLDAQWTWRLRNSKSQIRLGGSNILNKYYKSAFGNPDVGGLYYISLGHNL
jgi:outer membrane receptor protein involved in Fe transport